jgi:collagen type I/II/III/V/XI/XXIV/XXVII alpha
LAPSAASVTYNSGSGTLSIFEDLTLVSNLDLPVGLTGPFTTATDGNGGTLINLECFAAGTPHGERPVETLKPGDRVVTLSGEVKPIEWVGHRHIDCRRHPDPRLVSPVCIRAGAFGPGQPRRDVWLSPDHAVFFEDVLIPIKYLVNGTTIAQMSTRKVVYYHIELDRHDVLLAEGLSAESYLDTGNRMRFANAGRMITLHPDFATLAWQAVDQTSRAARCLRP